MVWLARAAALAACWLLAAPAAAEPDECPAFVVRTLPLEVVEDFTQSLGAMLDQDDAARTVAYAPDHLLGYVRTRFLVRGRVVEDGGCRTLFIESGLRDTRLYVAKELPPGSCEFNHVYAHELEHVRIYREHLQQLPARTLAHLNRSADALARLPADKQVQTALSLAMEALLEVMPQHQAHDSPEEYARNGEVCDGKLRSALKRALQRR